MTTNCNHTQLSTPTFRNRPTKYKEKINFEVKVVFYLNEDIFQILSFNKAIEQTLANFTVNTYYEFFNEE